MLFYCQWRLPQNEHEEDREGAAIHTASRSTVQFNPSMHPLCKKHNYIITKYYVLYNLQDTEKSV